MLTKPEMITADDPREARCTDHGLAEHDWRIVEYNEYPGGPDKESFRCVWCHVVACGNPGDHDPCWRAYHHRDDHKSRRGVTWPIGGNRPDGPKGTDGVPGPRTWDRLQGGDPS